MSEAIQEFRYLTPQEIENLLAKEGSWLCATCQDSNVDVPIISHCGTLHASHRDCEIVWLKKQNCCSLCRKNASWNKISTWSEYFFSYFLIYHGLKFGSRLYEETLASGPTWKWIYLSAPFAAIGFQHAIPLMQAIGMGLLSRAFHHEGEKMTLKLKELSHWFKETEEELHYLKNLKSTHKNQLEALKKRRATTKKGKRRIRAAIETKKLEMQTIETLYLQAKTEWELCSEAKEETVLHRAILRLGKYGSELYSLFCLYRS